MRQIASAAVLLVAVSASQTEAKVCDSPDWYRRVQTWVQSLIDRRPADHDIIAPPADVDPKMVLVPPGWHGTMRIIPPPGEPGR